MIPGNPSLNACLRSRWFLVGWWWTVIVGFPCFASEVAQADSSKRISVLIVDGYSNHDWERTTRLLKELLDEAKIFDVHVSTAPPSAEAPGWDTWRPEFNRYDVVIQTCNDIRGGPSWPRTVQLALENYVQGGGGLYVFHGANNAFLDWPEYDRMIGLGWRPKERGWALAIHADGSLQRFSPGEGRRTSHAPRQPQTVVRMNGHPIHSGFPLRWRTPDLEIYQYVRGAAENLQIISYAYDAPTQMNWPIEWVVQYGKGRTYGATFGHIGKQDPKDDALRCVGVQTVVIRALQWLAHRKVDWPLPQDFPSETTLRTRPGQ